MATVKVLIFVESRYIVNRKRIKEVINTVLDEHSITSACEVSLAFIGDRKMRSLNKKYRNLDKTTNILSFPLSEGEQTVLPGNILRLGDIVISYPYLIKEASQEDEMVDDRVDMLVRHGLTHLLGIHHQ
ncbi:MAG: putative rRNA maturation factor [Patescibacteria group bacterium]|jgi:probable rRNA maturation factor|nr:putative rRNA maturation factor [Patescibacteria group bacterium]